MLFFLTGDIQTGKTRWLEALVEDLILRGTECCGVLAPGKWLACGPGNARDTGAGAGGAFEKLGIDNVLLPSRERITFAKRRDLAVADGSLDEGSQAARANLMWVIDDRAIAQVNRHFDALATRSAPTAFATRDATEAESKPALLVVDEFGQLELLRGEGLTSAVALIDRGATEAFPHALIIVRDTLLDTAFDRFSRASWGGMRALSPDEEGRRAVLSALGA